MPHTMTATTNLLADGATAADTAAELIDGHHLVVDALKVNDIRTIYGFTPTITGSPLLGEHTDQVLTALGYDADAVAKMHADQVV